MRPYLNLSPPLPLEQIEGNLYIYPDGSTHQFGQDFCANYDSAGPGEIWASNTCIMASAADTYSNFGCDPSNPETAPATHNNSFFTPGGAWSVRCASDGRYYSLKEWQALGFDAGTTAAEAPDTGTV